MMNRQLVPLQILFLIPRLSRGGLERSASLTIQALRQAGYSVSLATQEMASANEFEHVLVLPLGLGWIPYLLHSRPSAIIAEHPSLVQYLAQLVGVPWIQMLQNCYAWTHPSRVPVLRWMFSRASAIWTVSDQVRNYMSRIYNIPSKRMQVIPNPIDIMPSLKPKEVRHHIRTGYHIAPDTRLLLFLGRVDPTKSVVQLVEAVSVMRHNGYETELAIVGHDHSPYCQQIERRIEALELGSYVHLIPWQEQVTDWYAAADLFILPSMFEGSSLAAGEALACGLPCVLTRVGDAEELAVASDAVILLDPPQGTYLDIHPHNYGRQTIQDNDFPTKLATAIQKALDQLTALKSAAEDHAPRLRAQRAPQVIASKMIQEMERMGIVLGRVGE